MNNMTRSFFGDALTNATGDVTAESIMEACKNFWRKNNPQTPDVYVVPASVFEELKKLTEEKHSEQPLDFFRVYGARVESFDTEEECTMRAMELYKQGVRVALCFEGKI